MYYYTAGRDPGRKGGGMKKKQEVITFKVDEDLGGLIRETPNRSQFIRQAIISALGSACPLCNGSGILTSNQKRHWDALADHHAISRCKTCDERILVCRDTNEQQCAP